MMISRSKGIFCSHSMSVFGVRNLGKYRKSKSVIVCSILQAAMLVKPGMFLGKLLPNTKYAKVHTTHLKNILTCYNYYSI